MLLGRLVASFWGNILADKEINRTGKCRGRGINRAGERVLRTGYGNNKMGF